MFFQLFYIYLDSHFLKNASTSFKYRGFFGRTPRAGSVPNKNDAPNVNDCTVNIIPKRSFPDLSISTKPKHQASLLQSSRFKTLSLKFPFSKLYCTNSIQILTDLKIWSHSGSPFSLRIGKDVREPRRPASDLYKTDRKMSR